MIDRRHFLLSSVALPLGIVGAAKSAQALMYEEPSVGLVQEYLAARAAACGGSQTYHQQLLADLRTTLDGEKLPAQAVDQQLAQATCPLCGCKLTRT
ncbi:MAG: hypothetical protein HWD60_18450 [Defluviicoccus sp.]|nr:MAG: hypothetical protein HWD60_18450 [Defluviicoccus sp.]